MLYEHVVFLEALNVYEAQEQGLRAHGGLHGVRDPHRVDAAVAAPQSGYCATLGEMAATYAHGLAKGHGFVDGNKRTAAIVLMTFLGANGFPVVLADEWIGILESVADGTTTKHQLVDVIVARLLGGVDVPIEYA